MVPKPAPTMARWIARDTPVPTKGAKAGSHSGAEDVFCSGANGGSYDGAAIFSDHGTATFSDDGTATFSKDGAAACYSYDAKAFDIRHR